MSGFISSSSPPRFDDLATREAIEALAEKAKVPRKKVYGYLKALVEEGKAQQHGKGVKGDPFMYSKVLPHSLSSDRPLIGEERERESEIQNPVTSADATKPDESGEQSHAGRRLEGGQSIREPEREPARVLTLASAEAHLFLLFSLPLRNEPLGL